VWTARRVRARAWLIQGADGPTWLAGSVPGASSRLRPVALTPHGAAAGLRVSQSCACGPLGRRYGYRPPATLGTRQVFPVPVRSPKRFSVAALVWSRPTVARSRITSRACGVVARPGFPTVVRATRNAVCTPPCQWRCRRGSGGSGSVSMRIAGSTVRSIRILRVAEAVGRSHTVVRSWPTVSTRWRCSSLRVIRRLASVASGAATAATWARASFQRRAHAPATRRVSGSTRS
jgi:hypothetical protein